MTPETEEDLAEMIRASNAPLSIRGGGTQDLPGSGPSLSTEKLSGIRLYEPGALTVVAAAGTPLAELEETLAAENQRLAFEPYDARVLLETGGAPTIGGVMAANRSGPRRIQVGAARDFALGLRFVDGAGRIVKNGGRVMKNVTGYDLVKLMCGAFGRLGVLTEVALKVLPVPETEATLMLRDLPEDVSIRAMASALGSPFEVSGAGHCAKIIEGGPVTLLRVEGFETSVRYRIGQLKERLADFGAEMQVMEDGASRWVWDGVRDAPLMRDLPGDVWRVSCKPSEATDLMARSGARGWYFDWGGGLIWVRMPEGEDLRAQLGRFAGHATLMRAAPETRARLGVLPPEPPGIARLSEGLRARFDPRGIFNPGLAAPEAG
ncbi:FAD-binding protein [Sulfitobacter sp. D35]|uniref:FAD-binding protein n=1 Tax=Sulfitobacter sp. D35 TaxID=3083252 RepID=UPI00296F7BD5|nr:FAD-binding protein [Sulfitobacter sp. D35]MDW4498976.1 FAD-binding protein [Sulfitobacter sp. D35]